MNDTDSHESDEPHRPPKYVDGVYKPHFSDPEADYVLMKASLLPQRHSGGLYWARTDGGGGAAGVVRSLDGEPITEGADMPVARVYDRALEYNEGEWVDFSERIDAEHIPPLPGEGVTAW